MLKNTISLTIAMFEMIEPTKFFLNTNTSSSSFNFYYHVSHFAFSRTSNHRFFTPYYEQAELLRRTKTAYKPPQIAPLSAVRYVPI